MGKAKLWSRKHSSGSYHGSFRVEIWVHRDRLYRLEKHPDYATYTPDGYRNGQWILKQSSFEVGRRNWWELGADAPPRDWANARIEELSGWRRIDPPTDDGSFFKVKSAWANQALSGWQLQQVECDGVVPRLFWRVLDPSGFPIDGPTWRPSSVRDVMSFTSAEFPNSFANRIIKENT